MDRLSHLLGKPLFWAFTVGVLFAAFCLNVLSHNRFDPGMAYSNFLQNWVQLLALAVTSVISVSTAAAVGSLHEKHDELHRAIHGEHSEERAE